jgi:hypothetical protein
MFAPHSIASGKQAKKKRAGDPARLSSSELDFIERLPRPAARLIARNKNDREVLVELDVHGAHLALGIVDLVDALFLLLDALGARAAVTLAISASGTLSSSSSAKATVLPKARTGAMAKAFIMGKILKARFTYRENYPIIVSDI